MKTAILLLFVSVLVVSCAHPGYQKKFANGMHRVGYTDTSLGGGMYRVSYLDLDSTLSYNGFIRRGAEIANENNKEFFCVVGTNQNQEYKPVFLAGTIQNWGLLTHEGTIKLSDHLDGDCYRASDIIGALVLKNLAPVEK